MQCRIKGSGLEIQQPQGWQFYNPRQTKIVEVHDCGRIAVVREDYYQFKGSNVYAIDENFNIVWEAQLPHQSDTFANELVRDDCGFVTSTWNGIKVLIEQSSGKITKLGITK